MAFIREPDRQKLVRHFEALNNPVRLVFFTQEFECESCRDTHALLEETAALSGKLTLEQYNFQLDRPQVEQYGVDKIPAVVVAGERDYGIRFYGAPLGYAFSSLLEAVLAVSAQDSGLATETRGKLRAVTSPLHIQVLTTPT